MSKPTIIFVPGAWHVPKHYAPITSYLESQGYPVICKQNLSCGAENPATNSNDDAAEIRKSIDNVNGDVIMVMHSYGGIPGSSAAKGASNVIGLVFLAAFVIPAGKSLMDAPKHENTWIRLEPEKGTSYNVSPRTIFYHDADDATAAEAESLLQSQTLASFGVPSNETSWPDLPKTYAVAADDHTLPTFVQEQMVEAAGGWLNVTHLQAGHSPWMTKLQETNQFMEDSIQRFVKNKTL